MYTRFGEVKFEFPATAALKSEHQGPRFLVPIISRLWPSCVIILAFLGHTDVILKSSYLSPRVSVLNVGLMTLGR